MLLTGQLGAVPVTTAGLGRHVAQAAERVRLLRGRLLVRSAASPKLECRGVPERDAPHPLTVPPMSWLSPHMVDTAVGV